MKDYVKNSKRYMVITETKQQVIYKGHPDYTLSDTLKLNAIYNTISLYKDLELNEDYYILEFDNGNLGYSAKMFVNAQEWRNKQLNIILTK